MSPHRPPTADKLFFVGRVGVLGSVPKKEIAPLGKRSYDEGAVMDMFADLLQLAGDFVQGPTAHVFPLLRVLTLEDSVFLHAFQHFQNICPDRMDLSSSQVLASYKFLRFVGSVISISRRSFLCISHIFGPTVPIASVNFSGPPRSIPRPS